MLVWGVAATLGCTCAFAAGTERTGGWGAAAGVATVQDVRLQAPRVSAQLSRPLHHADPGEPSLRLPATMLAQVTDTAAKVDAEAKKDAEAKVDAAPKVDAVLKPDAALKGDAATENRGKSAATAMATAVDIGANKSYAIPAMEILGFDFLVNRLNHQFSSSTDYDVTAASIRRNLRGKWATDNDPYQVNQFAHPYQGSMYHGFARSAGLNYWESAGYTFLGSVVWEVAGEKTRPAVNDQIASGVAGSFLGEALFRMSSLVLERSDGMPLFWREVAAAAISPSTGFNRLAYGDRFDPVFSSRGAYYYSRLQVGLSAATRNVQGTSTANKRNELLTDFYMEYGLPGNPSYQYTRPFDYFAFQFTASSANVFENIMTRGLLLGQTYERGQDFRGVWGLYGSYDYISPQTYRISSTALSLGTTGQWWLSQDIALQGTAMLGAGYAAVGTLRGGATGEYHYGTAPQALLAMRLIFGNRLALDVAAREYFVSNVGARSVGGRDNIARADVSLTMRIKKQHSVAVKYLWNRRDATYAFLGNGTQERSTVGIFYSYDGDGNFGAIDWR
jgi:hypothetical protein